MSRLDALGAMGDAGPPLVERIIAAFVAGAETTLTAIRRAIETRTPTELARLAHRLGGSAANLGAVRVSGICRELEQHARSGDIRVRDGSSRRSPVSSRRRSSCCAGSRRGRGSGEPLPLVATVVVLIAIAVFILLFERKRAQRIEHDLRDQARDRRDRPS